MIVFGLENKTYEARAVMKKLSAGGGYSRTWFEALISPERYQLYSIGFRAM